MTAGFVAHGGGRAIWLVACAN